MRTGTGCDQDCTVQFTVRLGHQALIIRLWVAKCGNVHGFGFGDLFFRAMPHEERLAADQDANFASQRNLGDVDLGAGRGARVGGRS